MSDAAKPPMGATLARIATSVFMVLQAACGTVVVHENGSGGSAGVGGTGSVGSAMNAQSSASTGSSTSVTIAVSSSSGTLVGLCDAFCAATGDCYPDCQTKCQGYFGGPCGSIGLSVVGCITTTYDKSTCSFATDCEGVLSALFMCEDGQPPMCGPSTCAGNADSCACAASCAGGDRKAVCNTFQGHTDCTCFVDGLPVLGCGPGGDPMNDTCQLSKSCCSL